MVVDSDTGIDVETIVTVLGPWRTWLQVTDIIVTNTSPDDRWLERVGSTGAEAVFLITEQPEFGSELKSAAEELGLLFAGSYYPTDGDHLAAFFHEMSHHHFELGGLNEWTNEGSLHGPSVLQHLSVANSISHFPAYTVDELCARRAAAGRRLDALDIGCGAISRLRWGAVRGLVHVTGIDPLLSLYQVILAYHGLDRLPFIEVNRAIAAGAENLHCHVADGSIDFAYCCNALDHVEDPPLVIERLAGVLRPGALFALEFATREGSRQGWQQLHQFDLFLDGDSREIMCERHDGRIDRLIPEGVELWVKNVVWSTDDHTAVVLQRGSGASP